MKADGCKSSSSVPHPNWLVRSDEISPVATVGLLLIEPKKVGTKRFTMAVKRVKREGAGMEGSALQRPY